MTDPSLDTARIPDALARLAFASAADSQRSRSLAWTAPADLAIDLDDPVQRRFGDYELLALIGRGGMGAVYRARQHNLDREVALKFLAAGPWASDEFIARFRREAQAAARMQHPNIVDIYDTGVRDGLYYFSMRLVDGPTLGERLRERGPYPPRAAARLMRTVAEAIDYAHRLGVLHLDLKPGNILLDADDEPLVADFGLARRIDEGPLADLDEISGTPSYMAPEQANARLSGIGPAADIYGLGAILYELLVGEPPFRGHDVRATLQHVLNDPPPAPRSKRHDIPADLEAICLKCLDKDPARRYPNARALADDLGRFLAGDLTAARTPRLGERVWRWSRRNRTAAALLAIIAIGLASTLFQAQRAEAQRVLAEQQRQRSERMSGLLVAAIEAPVDASARTSLDRSAERIVGWLDQHLHDDPAAQAEVLENLVQSFERADKPAVSRALLWPVVRLLGQQYRAQVAAGYAASGRPRDALLAAILLQEGEADRERQLRQSALIERALDALPEDIDAWAVAAYYCQPDWPCHRRQPAARLAALQPGNAANWALRIEADMPAAALREALHAGATAPTLDDHFARVFGLGFEAVQNSPVAVPAVLQRTLRGLSGDLAVSEIVAWLNMYTMPIPNWQHMVRACRPTPDAPLDPAVAADCYALANKAAYQAQGLVTQMIGSAMIRHLRPEGPDADRARELRRSYLYTYSARDARTPEQWRASRDELMGRETLAFGELEAAKRTLDRAGIPRDPPPGWSPDDPAELLTGYQRDIYRARAAELARQPIFLDRTAPADAR